MDDFESKVRQLNDLIISGKTIEAITLFYSDSVSMQENEEMPRVGKEYCLSNEKKNLERIIDLNSKLLNQSIDRLNGVVFSEWEIVYVTADQKKYKLNEVSVQKWQNGKIEKEKFFYNKAIQI